MKEIVRSIAKQVQKDLKEKYVVISGPRQCGKTTLAKSIRQNSDCLNYDIQDDREIILKRSWDRSKDTVILDEIHKMPNWKSWLKGIYDKEGVTPSLLLTGSARLDAFKKIGDSLAGRYFYYRLHPLDLKELTTAGLLKSEDQSLQSLLDFSGYPEPFLKGSVSSYRRWRQTHLDMILRQDMLDFTAVRDVQSIVLLVELLRSKVGAPLSINALANDLQRDHKTISKWLGLLEDLFVIFRLTPYSKDILRAVKKEPKFYFYDSAYVTAGDAAKLENLVACALLKESHRLLDVDGQEFKLHFLKVKGGREIDFVLVPSDSSHRAILIEVKQSDFEVSPNFKLFRQAFKKPVQIQLVKELKRELTSFDGVQVRKAASWLCDFDPVNPR